MSTLTANSTATQATSQLADFTASTANTFGEDTATLGQVIGQAGEENKSLQFQGVGHPDASYWTKVPNAVIEALPLIKTLSQRKVIDYVIRHTRGYKDYKEYDVQRISLDEFMHGRKKADGTRLDEGTGLAKQSVIDGIERAIQDGFLICYIDNTDRGRETHYYRLRIEGQEPGRVYAVPPEKAGIAPWRDVPESIYRAVYAKFNGRCAYCGHTARHWHYDHIVPVERGGTDDFDNLALACPQCNMIKGNRTPDEWGRPVVLPIKNERIELRDWVKYLREEAPVKDLDYPRSNSWTSPSLDSGHRTYKEKEIKKEGESLISPTPLDDGHDNFSFSELAGRPSVAVTDSFFLRHGREIKEIGEPAPSALESFIAQQIGRHRLSTSAQRLLTKQVKVPTDRTTLYPSPEDYYQAKPELFAEFILQAVRSWNKRGLTSAEKLVKYIRRYDIGWLETVESTEWGDGYENYDDSEPEEEVQDIWL